MKLRKFKKRGWFQEEFEDRIEPVESKDILLFKHCFNGNNDMPASNFEKLIKPILEAHGCCVSLTDQTC